MWRFITRILLPSLLFAGIIIPIGMGISRSQRPNHFVYLATAFNDGSFAVNNLPDSYADKVIWRENIYIPLGPMPGILLMPWVALFGINFQEIWLACLVTLFNGVLVVNLLKHIGVTKRNHIVWLSVFFFCGTLYLSVLALGRSWHLSHILATLFLLLAINESLDINRPGLIGLWWGFGLLSRGSLFFAFPFFVWSCWQQATSSQERPSAFLRQCAKLLMGLSPALGFYLWYNYDRFGIFTETGYAYAVLGDPILSEALKYGLFNLAHIPKNLFVLLFATPIAVPNLSAPVLTFPYFWTSNWGMGIFFTTPAFAYAFGTDWRSSLVRISGVTIICLLVPLLTYYGIGYTQFGYRYAMDFYPFLFIPVAIGISRQFNSWARFWIVVGIVVNVWGAWWVA